MKDFDLTAFGELAVLPPHRIRYHLLRFDEGLVDALNSDFKCDAHRAGNLITQAHMIGFPSLANSLEAAFDNLGRSEGTLRSAHCAIETARSKIAELLRQDSARYRAS